MAIEVHVLDHQFGGVSHALGSFIIEGSDELILVESGPYSTFTNLKSAIERRGYKIDQIKHVLLTHIHLDHAGGAWKFAETGAKIYVHKLGYKHMLDPSRLMASARQIYQDQMDLLWGDMRPIPENKLVSIEDGDQVHIGNLTFEAIYTPGHAKHHISWKVDDAIFTGDVAGAKINGGPVVPPCPPPDIDIEEWKHSLSKLAEFKEVKRYFLTHFGEVLNLEAHRNELEETLDDYAQFIKPLYEGQIPISEAIPQFVNFVNDRLEKQGMKDDDKAAYQAANPPEMSVAGLYRYWKKRSVN